MVLPVLDELKNLSDFNGVFSAAAGSRRVRFPVHPPCGRTAATLQPTPLNV